MRPLKFLLISLLVSFFSGAYAQIGQSVVDIPTRAGVTQRILLLTPDNPKAAVVLFAGGHGGLQIFSNGTFKWGGGNFLVRTRQLYADAGFVVAVVDAPSDRQSHPFLQGFRQKPEHVADIRSVIVWLREKTKVPVWLIGTSRGTQSVAYVATALVGKEGPDGIVLTSTILKDEKSRPVAALPLEEIHIPVLVVHHQQDECAHCPFALTPELMGKLGSNPRVQLLAFQGGETTGDPCEAMAFHGYNGLEREVVSQIADWILVK